MLLQNRAAKSVKENNRGEKEEGVRKRGSVRYPVLTRNLGKSRFGRITPEAVSLALRELPSKTGAELAKAEAAEEAKAAVKRMQLMLRAFAEEFIAKTTAASASLSGKQVGPAVRALAAELINKAKAAAVEAAAVAGVAWRKSYASITDPDEKRNMWCWMFKERSMEMEAVVAAATAAAAVASAQATDLTAKVMGFATTGAVVEEKALMTASVAEAKSKVDAMMAALAALETTVERTAPEMALPAIEAAVESMQCVDLVAAAKAGTYVLLEMAGVVVEEKALATASVAQAKSKMDALMAVLVAFEIEVERSGLGGAGAMALPAVEAVELADLFAAAEAETFSPLRLKLSWTEIDYRVRLMDDSINQESSRSSTGWSASNLGNFKFQRRQLKQRRKANETPHSVKLLDSIPMQHCVSNLNLNLNQADFTWHTISSTNSPSCSGDEVEQPLKKQSQMCFPYIHQHQKLQLPDFITAFSIKQIPRRKPQLPDCIIALSSPSSSSTPREGIFSFLTVSSPSPSSVAGEGCDFGEG